MKTKLKWVPVPRYHIAATEEWLDKMAAKGLLLQYFWGPFAQFEVGEPKPERRYRLDVNPSTIDTPDAPKTEMSELYEDFGRSFVVSIWSHVFFVFYSDDPQAVEPFTDEWSRAATLPPLVKHCRSMLLALCFDVILYCSIQFQHSFDILHPLAAFPLCLILLCISQIGTVFADFRSVVRIKKRLEDGRPLRDLKPNRLQKPLNTAAGVLTCGLILCLLYTLFAPSFLHPAPLEQIPSEWSPLLLSDMAGPGYLPDPYENIPDDFDPSRDKLPHGNPNYVERQWFPLSWSPWQYTIEQSGKGADGTRLQLTIQRYDMLSASLSVRALDELTDEAPYQEITMSEADRFLVSEEGDTVYAALGRRVVRVSCFHWMDLEPWYDEIVEMLQAPK